MNHRSVHELGAVARIVPAGPDAARAVRRARLERFAALLDRSEGKLHLLTRIEYISKSAREAMRTDESPLAVAYADPVFRAQGLASDRLGEVMRFFALSWAETHHLFCDCHYGSMAAVPARSRSGCAPPPRSKAWASSGSRSAAALPRFGRAD